MRNLEEYLELPYTVILRGDEDGDIVARVEELPGCSAHGRTRREALENLDEAQRLWIADAIEAGDPVPDPRPGDALPSGKWVQRVPRTLHLRLVEAARQENVSLNQFVTSLLSEAVGQRQPNPPSPGMTQAVNSNFEKLMLMGVSPVDRWFGRRVKHVVVLSQEPLDVQGRLLDYDANMIVHNPYQCNYDACEKWSIQHSPKPSESHVAIELLLNHLKNALPNQFTRVLKSSLHAGKKEKLEHR